MAGIGFEIRKLLQQDDYLSTTSALAISGLISSGPWLFSILGIFLIGFISSSTHGEGSYITEFSVTVTYIISFSLILTGPLQLLFTRFVADKAYEKQDELIVPNLLGILVFTSAVSFVFLIPIQYFLKDLSLEFRISGGLSFIVLSNLWMVMTILSGIKAYKSLIIRFFLGSVATVALSVLFQKHLTDGILFGFYFGQATLLCLLLDLIFKHYPIIWSIRFDFLKRQHFYLHLILIGGFYNVGIWIDKFIFWFTTHTSQVIAEPFRASIIYDLPIFFSYLTIISGMSIFLIRIETDFAETCDQYFKAIQNSSLKMIQSLRDKLVHSIKTGIFDIFKIQTMTAILAILAASPVFKWLNISPLYIPLFSILVIAIIFQMVFLAMLNICFYLEFRKVAVNLCLIFFVVNGLLSFATTYFDVRFYGLGYLCANLCACIYGWFMINHMTKQLERHVFINARKIDH